MPYYLARNEQGQVHAAAAFAKMRNRLQTFASTASTRAAFESYSASRRNQKHYL